MEERTLEDFVAESNRIEGIVRRELENGDPNPQLVREVEVTRAFVMLPHPTVNDLENFVAVCTGAQAHPAVLRRRVGQDVRVGNYYPPAGGPEIEPELQALLDNMGLVLGGSAFRTHLAYENLHPFTDGNGRSGRALWLWQMNGVCSLGFLHAFYYQMLDEDQR